MILRARTAGVDATRALAAVVAAHAAPGDVLLLAGELGAGKTAFVQGFGAALGVEEQITSPTFTLAHQYEAPAHAAPPRRVPARAPGRAGRHRRVRAARRETASCSSSGATPSRRRCPNDYLEITMRYGEGDDERHLELRCVGGRWSARHRTLAEQLQPWADA